MLLHLRPKSRLEGGNWEGNGKIAFRYAELSAGLGGVADGRWRSCTCQQCFRVLRSHTMACQIQRHEKQSQRKTYDWHRSTHPDYRQGKRMTFIFSQR